MRIGLVHSLYSTRSPSGENGTVLTQADALREAGHDVLLVTRSTDDEEHRPLHGLRSGLRVATGLGGSPAAELAAFEPDVVHVHNLFPNLGTRWLAQWPGPVVATLHNYRYACANAMLFRDGATCTACPDGRPSSALVHACYRDSRLATAPLAIANRHGMGGHPVVRRADRVVALSERARSLFVRLGVPEGRLALVPNFSARMHGSTTPAPAEPRFVAVGRLSGEKGFADLLRDWPAGPRLDLIGTGPLAGPLAAMAGPGVQVLGHVDNRSWRERLCDYTALVLASPVSEGGVPQTVVEAWEGSVPVIARQGSGGADEVARTAAGRTYADATGLARALAEVTAQQAVLRPLARASFEERYDQPAWTSAIVDVYESCLRGSREAARRP